MGNCQAIDSATLVIQHPNGKVDSFFTPVSASKVMKMNPGHYVALLLTTTLYTPPSAGGSRATRNNGSPLRITRIKLLRPTDTLALGHAYRLVTYHEVMKGLWAKKQAKMKQQQCGKTMTDKLMDSDFEAVSGKPDMEKINKAKKERQSQRSGNNNNNNNNTAHKSRGGWQPSLKSISEAGS